MKSTKTLTLLALCLLTRLTANAFPIQACDTTWYTGEGTQYGGVAGSNGGNCGIYVEEDDIFHCAMNHSQYDSSFACGACVRAFGPLGEVTVKVVDRCPECKPGDIDFSTGSFVKIGTMEAGRIPIRWQFIPCEEEDIKVKFEKGTSQFYFKAIFYDIRYRISQLEYQRSDGTFVPIHREMYNFYVENAGIDEDKTKIGPYVFRLISCEGDTVTTAPIEYEAGVEINTGVQFPFHNCGEEKPTSIEVTMKEEPLQDLLRIEAYDIMGRHLRTYKDWDEALEALKERTSPTILKEMDRAGHVRYHLRAKHF